MAEPGLKKQLYDAQVDGDTHEEEEARHLQVDKEAEIENNDPCIPGIGHEDAAYSIAAPGDCDGVSSQHGAVAEEPVENLQQKHLRADAVMPEAEGCNPSEVPVEIVVDSDEDGRREQGREGEETVNSLPDGEQFTQLQGQLDTYDGTECIGAEEEEEEYDEDPFLGEDPSVDEVEEDAVVTEQSSVAQVAPHAVPHPEEGDNRNTTPEADGVEEEAQEEEHEDTNASHQNRNKVSSERGSSPAEIKANLSEHRNLALNGPSERRRSGPQAPIVWDPSVIRPKSLFDHHQRLLDVPAPTHSEKQDFGGDVQRYTDKNLKITIASESTIGSHRLPQGKSKRRTHFGAGGFELEGCTALPGQESRNSLQLYRSSRRQQRGPKWNRRVTFTAKLNQGEKVEYVHHGDCISVRLVNLPLNFWYSAVLAQRFVVDPAEFDADYEAGVAKVELGMRARPEQWARRWINSNISRLARAKALRSFMKDRSGDLKPATFFYHFMNLCKGIQKLNPPISRDESEKAYERGCARTVGCATGETFEMLAALPRDTIGDVMRALGMELCTSEFISGRAGVDARLCALVKLHCPPHCFRDVVCPKAGKPATSRLLQDVPHRTQRTDATYADVHSAGRVERTSTVHPQRPGFRTQHDLHHIGAGRWDRYSAGTPVRSDSEHPETGGRGQNFDRRQHHGGIRGTRGENSRPHSPSHVRHLAQESKRAADDRSRGGHNSHIAVTYSERVSENGAQWVRGGRDTLHEPSTHKNRVTLSTHDKQRFPAGRPDGRSGQRGAAQNGTRVVVDRELYLEQRAGEKGCKGSTFRLGVDGEDRLHPMRSGHYVPGTFVHSHTSHLPVQLDTAARRDVGLREGGQCNSCTDAGKQRSSANAQFVEDGHVLMGSQTEASFVTERVSAVDAPKFPGLGRDQRDDPQDFAVRRKRGMLDQQESEGVFSREMRPRRRQQQEPIVLEEEDLPPPPPQKLQPPPQVAAVAHSPRTVPVYRAVQDPVPVAAGYDTNQFQAAVTHAVQEVVKRLGVPVPTAVPEAAAAVAVRDMRTSAPHARPEVRTSATASLHDAQKHGQPAQEHYAVGCNVVQAVTMHAARENRLTRDGYVLHPTYTEDKYPAPPHRKRSRDDNSCAVGAPINNNYGVRKVYRREIQDIDYHTGAREQPTRYPDVEIVPEVSIVSHENGHDAHECTMQLGGHASIDARSQGYQSRLRDQGAFNQSREHRAAGRSSLRDRSPHVSCGGVWQPQDACAVTHTQDKARPSVGGFLSGRKRQLNARPGGQAPDTQTTTGFLQAEAQGECGPLRTDDTSHNYQSQCYPADLQASKHVQLRHGERYTSETYVRTGTQVRQSSPDTAQDRKEGSLQRLGGGALGESLQQHERSMQPETARAPGPGSALHPGLLLATPSVQQMCTSTVRSNTWQQVPMNGGEGEVAHARDGVAKVAKPAPHVGSPNVLVAPFSYERAQGTLRKPSVKLRSGGSRVAASGRASQGSSFHTVDNEDAFAVGSCSFAVGDGLEKMGPAGVVINSGGFTHEVVSTAVSMAAGVIQEVVHGRRSTLVDPKAVLLQAANATQSTGAAAMMLGSLDPFTGVLRSAKMGDVGFLVLRPSASSKGDLEIISSWVPYTVGDHPGNDFSDSYYFASQQLRGQGTWTHDCRTDSVQLQPADLVIAGTDGLWDAVHFFGAAGHRTRQLVHDLYLVEQLDPGQLAEKLLLRAWGAVQEARSGANLEIVPPFMQEVFKRRQQHRMPVMPEDDIAVVVSYVLQA